MNPTYRVSSILKGLCLGFQILSVGIALFSLWAFFGLNMTDQMMDVYWARLSEDARAAVTYSPTKKVILQSLAAVSFFAPVLILIGAFRVFAALKGGDPFRPQSVRSVRFLGASIVAYAISRIVIYPVSVIAMTYDNPKGLKELSIAIDTNTLVVLMIGVILVIVGHVFTHAATLADENRQFV
ncbi:MAG: DUF2975 domain-containing protein [Pseudomonadota bacterium]